MERLTYILDTTVIADRMKAVEPVTQRLTTTIAAGHAVYLCQPVYYEVIRGVLKANATRKQQFFESTIVPMLGWLPVTDADWRQAARFWAQARNAGYQLSDVDLLVAALAQRLNGIIVSSDDDFDALPVRRENWREPAP